MASTVLGKVTCVPRGNYNEATEYTVLDIVTYGGGSYMALKTVTGVTPSNDGTNWMLLAERGEDGVDGATGPTGETGAPGAAAGFGEATATIDDTTGTPSVSVELSGPDTAKVFAFSFSGLKGETGAKGDTGDKGDTGATGPQGVSVTDAEINESGRLIITLSAGEPIDAGNAVGPTGAKGDTGATGPEGASVSRTERTSGTGAPGTTDTYTVYLTDGSTGGTFNVYNGSNGTGSGDFMADGSVPMSGTLQMGGNRITNVGAPTADTDAVRQSDLKAVSDEVDKILDGTTPVAIPAATTAKIGGVIVGDGLSVETNGTISADSQFPEGGTNGQILTKTANGETWADPPDTGVTTFNNRSGAVTPQAGDYSADMIEFADGETFQQKYDAGELTGPQGEPGPAGADGAQGPKGDTGPQGEKGDTGDTGPAGADGGYYTPSVDASGNLTWAASKAGMPSVSGANIKGPQGEQGPQGQQGAQGPAGADGQDGAQGPQGPQGPAGENGTDATINGVNALTLNATGGLTGSQSGSTYTISGNGLKPLLRTATLTTSGWNTGLQMVTVNGVSSDSDSQLIYVSPADNASAKAWGEAGVFCVWQGNNSLQFICNSTPSANIIVNISIQEARA